MEVSFHQKIIWLQKYYYNYPIEWYYKQPNRTEAIYRRKFNNFQEKKLREETKKVKEKRRTELDDRSFYYNQLSQKIYGRKLTELTFVELKKLFENN